MSDLKDIIINGALHSTLEREFAAAEFQRLQEQGPDAVMFLVDHGLYTAEEMANLKKMEVKIQPIVDETKPE